MAEKPKTTGQLAFEALEFVTIKPGTPREYAEQRAAGGTSVHEAAALYDIDPSMLFAARKLEREGTPEEIAAVKAGTMALYSALKGKQHRATKPMERGHNPARLEAARLNSHVWQTFRAAIDALAGLPSPADVAAIAGMRKNMNAAVNDSLPRALNWIKEFDDVWNKETRNQDGTGDAGVGDKAP